MNGPFIAKFAMNGPFINIGPAEPLVEAGGAGEVGEFARGERDGAERREEARFARQEAAGDPETAQRNASPPGAAGGPPAGAGSRRRAGRPSSARSASMSGSCQSSLRQAASQVALVRGPRDRRQAVGDVSGGGERSSGAHSTVAIRLGRGDAVEFAQAEPAAGLRHDVEAAVRQLFRLAQYRAAADLVELVQTTHLAVIIDDRRATTPNSRPGTRAGDEGPRSAAGNAARRCAAAG